MASHYDQASVELLAETDDLPLRVSLLVVRRRYAAPKVLRLSGRLPVIADAMDRVALLRAVDGLKADAVAHELSALKKPPMRHSGIAATDALREEGTANLLAAARVVSSRGRVRAGAS